MNFFEYQEAARRQTNWLIFYYGVAVVLIILALYGVTAFLFHYGTAVRPEGVDWMELWDPALLGIVALATSVLILSGSLYKIISLSAGGEAVARMLDGRPIAPDTTQFQEKRLLNVVEEMAIASGTPIPRVFVLEKEAGINAFAAGFSPKDAVIGVTRGAMEKLTRDELQGVIGHEFSHILNGDMRLNIRLIGVLNGILVIALTGYWMFRIIARSSSGGSSRNKKGNPLLLVLLLGLAMMIIGYIGVFFARLIKSAVSRQREFLADASAVQFTRNPGGLAGALKKIAGLATGSRLQTEGAESASHLFFANGLGASFLGLLATHPPLEERIRRLEPDFAAGQPVTEAAGDGGYSRKLGDASVVTGVSPEQVVSLAGTLSADTLDRTSQQLGQIPAPLLNAARTPNQARAVIFGLLLDRDATRRARQLDTLANLMPGDVRLEMEGWLPELDALPRELRRPLASLATSTLRQLPPDQYPEFRAAVMHLVSADDEVSLFEYLVMRMLVRHLDARFTPGKRSRSHITTLAPLHRDAETALSALAWFGAVKESDAAQAFEAGRRELGNPEIVLLPATRSSLEQMDAALERLAEAIPPLKQKLVAAFTAAVIQDGTITPDEAEALHAAADALECPLPPDLRQ